MNDKRNIFRPALLPALLLCLLAGPLLAGTEARVPGEVDQVSEQVKDVFDELQIDTSGSTLAADHSLTIGKARSGARVLVSVEHSGEQECKVKVSTEAPADPDIEARFMRLMQAR